MKINSVFISLIITALLPFSGKAQMESFEYSRTLNGINDTWHTLKIPDDIFAKTKKDLSDIRIYKVLKNTDTTEIPYITKIAKRKTTIQTLPSSTLNTVSQGNNHYITIKTPNKQQSNQIQLSFRQVNYDWKVVLEGSHDQNEWFSILEDYRIVSIKNEQTNYHFSTLTFPPVNFTFLRLKIASKEKPILKEATVLSSREKKAIYDTFAISSIKISEHASSKTTTALLSLQKPLPVSLLSIAIKDTLDYYRPITIAYLADSVQTEKGYIYNFKNIQTGTLSSVEPNRFSFPSVTTQKIRITINNHDNTPITIAKIIAQGYHHEIIPRFPAYDKEANYYLVYGNTKIAAPRYDILQFKHTIPDSLVSITANEEKKIPRSTTTTATPLFQNKLWLWSIMGGIILILGWFSIKMIRENKASD
ncbi:DUF3999 family protein [Aquimarina hainanensis]|uniref:DUF3999 family protein n=1 Tax=Aquimarina hainanensis TaxID=1578017 RepID=A0ABW5NA91_9FLAO